MPGGLWLWGMRTLLCFHGDMSEKGKMAAYPGNYFFDIHPSHFKLAKESSLSLGQPSTPSERILSGW